MAYDYRQNLPEIPSGGRPIRFVEDENLYKLIYECVVMKGMTTERQIFNAFGCCFQTWRTLKNKEGSKIDEVIRQCQVDREMKVYTLFEEIMNDKNHRNHAEFVKEERRRLERKYGNADILIRREENLALTMNPEDLMLMLEEAKDEQKLITEQEEIIEGEITSDVRSSTDSIGD